jgi:hypothetical protein
VPQSVRPWNWNRRLEEEVSKRTQESVHDSPTWVVDGVGGVPLLTSFPFPFLPRLARCPLNLSVLTGPTLPSELAVK